VAKGVANGTLRGSARVGVGSRGATGGSDVSGKRVAVDAGPDLDKTGWVLAVTRAPSDKRNDAAAETLDIRNSCATSCCETAPALAIGPTAEVAVMIASDVCWRKDTKSWITKYLERPIDINKLLYLGCVDG
jgi:hypothetical protein